MVLKRAASLSALSATEHVPQLPIAFGYAQQINLDRLRTTPGPLFEAQPPDSPTSSAKVKSLYPNLLPLLDQMLQSKLSSRCCTEGTARLLFSSLFCVLSLLTLYALPAWFTPLSWLFAGTSLFGLSSVAVSCANNTFSDTHFVNHALGWICSIPLLMPFEAWALHSEAATWRMKKGNFM